MNYYPMGGLPALVWNGTTQTNGAATSDADGLAYRAIILANLGVPSAFKLTVNSVDFTPPTGSVDLDIEVMEDGIDVSNMFLRMVITEDDVTYEAEVYYDVTRDGIDDVPVTVDELGQIQNVVRTFPIDLSWVEANLEIVALLQDDTDRKMHAAASSKPKPDYSLRYYALGDTQHVGPSSGFYFYDNFEIFNFGTMTDTYSVDLTGYFPEGWSTGICDDAICYGLGYTVELDPGESKELHLMVQPTSPGYAAVTLELGQSMVSPAFPRALKYNYITDDVDVLIVDDDGAESFEGYFIEALTDNGYTHGVWDRLTVGPDQSTLDIFPVVLWGTGLASPTLDADDRAALGGYLDGGGALFITGQDIGYDMDAQGGAAYQWYQNYLHATYIHDDTNDYTLEGVPGDPISDGLDIVIQGGDGANNQEYPDDIDPADAFSSVIWSYSATKNGAVKASTGTYKVVYLGFGFEAINNAGDRSDVIRRSVDWLLTPSVGAGWVPNDDPLRVEKGPAGRLILSWGESCLASDFDYEIYEGSMGNYASHAPRFCSTSGATSKMLAPGLGDKYYLIVPAEVTFEGSHGLDSDDVERSQGTGACRPQDVGECSR